MGQYPSLIMSIFCLIFLPASFLYLASADDVVCSKRMREVVTIDEGDIFSFKTQAGPRYASKSRCVVTYKTGPSCSSIKFSCSKFDLNSRKKSCKGGDKMIILADGKKKLYCKKSAPDVTASNTMKVVFTSNKKTVARGAVCTAKCAYTAAGPPAPGPTDLCPEERPGFGSACRLPEMTCDYGKQTCCGESSAEYQMECRAGEWNGYYIDTVCMDASHVCANTTTEPSCICPAVFSPVCGADGQTYSNICTAACGGSKVACEGECPCTTTEPSCSCIEIFDPVCGADGETYSNSCKAACAGSEVACQGDCPCQ